MSKQTYKSAMRRTATTGMQSFRKSSRHKYYKLSKRQRYLADIAKYVPAGFRVWNAMEGHFFVVQTDILQRIGLDDGD